MVCGSKEYSQRGDRPNVRWDLLSPPTFCPLPSHILLISSSSSSFAPTREDHSRENDLLGGMSADKELYKLELLSLVTKVSQELFNHTKLQDKSLAEFVIAVNPLLSRIPLSYCRPVSRQRADIVASRTKQRCSKLPVQTGRHWSGIPGIFRQESRPHHHRNASKVQTESCQSKGGSSQRCHHRDGGS